MSESIIIGVDHGYAAMKTAHFSFPTGLVAHEHEPYTLSNVLEYGGKYYVVGSGRQPLQKDKTQTEDYYLLTLAAFAKEMAYRNAGTAADIHLAAGLPLTSFGRDKKAFQDYLCRGGKPVSFRYEGQDYAVTISNILRNYANSNRNKEQRVYQELKEYNFWRNLYGTKGIALVVYFLIIVREITLHGTIDIKIFF